MNCPFLNGSMYLQLLNADPRWMNAVSPQARIRWGKMVCEEFSDHFHLGPDKPEPDQRIFLVTLCDRRCCTSHQEKEIDIRGFIQLLRRGLRGLSYFGMIEPAYYVNVCEGTRMHGKRLVSWHLHLIAWGKSPREMKKRIERLNKERLLSADCRRSPCSSPKADLQGQTGRQDLPTPESSQESLPPV